MDKLVNKKYASFDYISRYTSVPYYYDTVAKKEVYGVGQQMNQTTPYVSHKVKSEDTLDSLALKYYNNPTYWWVIAQFNSITDPFIQLRDKFVSIKIPSISQIEYLD